MRKQRPTVMQFLLRQAEHKHNSLLTECLTFIKKQNFLQGDIPEQF